ncbi:MAG: prepilin-type N-terminal cleavage/methylation domain-containing protein, partial [Candidatus Scalindua sp.]|nr:prepilin-type N-terminal cleavage/methylation domain-containing protein [Candidatus Scalindua sp.]
MKINNNKLPIFNRQYSIINCNRSAFTLIELIIAISLASILILVTAMIFKQASSAFSQSDARSEVYQNVRAAFDIIKRDISGAMLNTNYKLFKSFDNVDKNDYLSIEAKDGSDIFTLLSSTPNLEDKPIALITYYLHTDNILYKLEKTGTDTLNINIGSFDPAIEDKTTYKKLGLNVSTLQFRFLDTDGTTWYGKREGEVGSDEWNSTTKKYLPNAVEVKMTVSDTLNRYTKMSTNIISIP